MTYRDTEGGLIVFLRLPRKGHVKTRLAESLGEDKAFEIYVRLVSHTLNAISNLPYPTHFFYEGGLPDPTAQHSSASYHLQSEGDLGHRMMQAFSLILRKENKAIIIGSDCPGITGQLIKEAFASLDTQDVVLGPAVDGGYYLLGCKKIIPALFEDIQWSSASVLKETIKRCDHLGLTYALLPQLRDVDTLEDYLILRQDFENE